MVNQRHDLRQYGSKITAKGSIQVPCGRPTIEHEQRFFTPWRIQLILVFSLSVLLYMPSMRGAPVWDDTGLISGEAFGGNSIIGALTHRQLGYFRPLISLSFVFDTSYSRGNPFLYHQTNLILHGLTASLVCILAMAVTRKELAGLFAGLCFVSQPVQVGTTAWIGGRTDCLCELFLVACLATLILYLRAPKWCWLACSCGAFLCATLSKEQAVAVMPAVLLAPLVFAIDKRKETGRIAWAFGVTLALFAAYWSHYAVLPQPVFYGFRETVGLALRSAAFYGTALLVPNRSSVITYTLNNNSALVWDFMGAAILVGIGVVLWLGWKRHRGIAWFATAGLLLYLPVCNLFPLPSLVVATYRIGEPGIAVACIFGTVGAFLLADRRYFLLGVLGANVAAGAYVTWLGAQMWRTQLGYFANVVNNDPHFTQGIENYSHFLDANGEDRDAAGYTNQAISWIFGNDRWLELIESHGLNAVTDETRARLRANFGRPTAESLGILIGSNASYAAKSGQVDHARRAAKVALEFAPDNPWLNYLYGMLIYRIDRISSVRAWEHALEINPTYVACEVSLAHDRLRYGQYREAAGLLERTLKTADYDGHTWLDLADARIGLRDLAGANSALDQATIAAFPVSQDEIAPRRAHIRAMLAASVK